MASILELAYDPVRGGFEVNFGKWHRDQCTGTAICNRWIVVWTAKQEPHGIVAVESFWGQGGMPLRHLFGTDALHHGCHPLDRPNVKIGAVQVRQSAQTLELWFASGGTVPRHHWEVTPVPEFDMTVWFSSKRLEPGGKLSETDTSSTSWYFKPKERVDWPIPTTEERKAVPFLAGFRWSAARLAVPMPIESVDFTPDDFQ